jgi:protein-disulfide isomerase
MINIKLFVGVLVGTFLIVGLSAFGLSKMSRDQERVNKETVEDLDTGTSWIKENGVTKVTVVEFACLQCSACRSAHPISLKLRQMDGVKYVWRFFPLVNTHKNAYAASKATETARKMGNGWEMADLLFEKQSEWSDSNNFEDVVVSYAENLDLDRDEFIKIYNSSEVEDQIKIDMALVTKLRLNGTPTFFVNGKLTSSNFVLSEVEKLLNDNK